MLVVFVIHCMYHSYLCKETSTDALPLLLIFFFKVLYYGFEKRPFGEFDCVMSQPCRASERNFPQKKPFFTFVLKCALSTFGNLKSFKTEQQIEQNTHVNLQMNYHIFSTCHA